MTSMIGNRGATGAGLGGKPFKEKIPSGYKKATIQNFTPEQLELFQSMFSHLGPDSFLSKLAGGDQSTFDQMESPALRQFSGLQGGIASRFSGGIGGGGPGALSSRRSSGFQNTMNQAASNFAQDLQAKRMGYQNQAIKDLMSMSGELLRQQPYEHALVEKQQKQGFNWGGAAGGALGGVGGFLVGGPAGAFAGTKLGYDVGSGLSGQGSSSGGNYDWSSFSRPQNSLAQGYDQEFRMNPSAMGY